MNPMMTEVKGKAIVKTERFGYLHPPSVTFQDTI
jgi:hypothetical protein